MSDVTAAGTAAEIVPAVPATAAAPAVTVTTTSVQDAIDAAVAAYRAKLEGQIKTSLGLAPGSSVVGGLVSRAVTDLKAVPGDIGSGVKTLVADGESVVNKTASAAVSVLPRWATYGLYALGAVGAITVVMQILAHLPAIHIG